VLARTYNVVRTPLFKLLIAIPNAPANQRKIDIANRKAISWNNSF